MEMGTFKISTKEWLRATTAAQRAKVSRSGFVRRAIRDAIERQQQPQRDTREPERSNG